MRFGAMNFPIKPVPEEITELAGLGFDFVEIAMDPPLAHYSLLDRERSRIRANLDRNDLGLICHLPTFVSTADLTESIREASWNEMLHSLKVAVLLEAEKVVLHPSLVSGMGQFVPETVKKHAFAFLDKLVSMADTLGIPVCHENMMPGYGLGSDPHYFQEVFRRFPSLQMTLDSGHANIGGSGTSNLQTLLKRFGDRLGHIHISDNTGGRDDHLAPGEGTVDFAMLMAEVQSLGYDDTITLEVFDIDRSRLVESREWLIRCCPS